MVSNVVRSFRRRLDGVESITGSTPAESKQREALVTGDRSLLDQLIGAGVVTCGFRNIPLAAPSINSGFSAWYGLGSWRPDDLGGEAALVGYSAVLNPCNYSGVADGEFSTTANIAAWGTALGGGAAVVIGVDLPCVLGRWSSGPANVPLVEPGSQGVAAAYASGLDERVTVHFPPNTTDLANPVPRLFVAQQFTPLHVPITRGRRLDVALVVRRSQVHGVTRSAGIVGHVSVSCMLGLSRTRSFIGV
jgi:hypothetical protein